MPLIIYGSWFLTDADTMLLWQVTLVTSISSMTIALERS